MDRDASQKLLTAFLSSSDQEWHPSKKRKTLKEHAQNSGAAASLRRHFLQELQQRSLCCEIGQIEFLMKCLKGTVSDQELLMASVPFLERCIKEGSEAHLSDLGASVVGLFTTRVISNLAEESRDQILLLVTTCLNPRQTDVIVHAALDLMTPKWIKTVERLCGRDVLLDVLHCANLHPSADIVKKATSLALKWPLQITQLEAVLKLDIDVDSTEHSQTDRRRMNCRWLLELLQSKRETPGYCPTSVCTI